MHACVNASVCVCVCVLWTGRGWDDREKYVRLGTWEGVAVLSGWDFLKAGSH